eukprot:g383.t1
MAKKKKNGAKKKKDPKKKKKKDKSKKAESDKKMSIEEERRQQLLTLAKNLKASIKGESSDFDRFQQQRDQLNHFWIVERKNLEDKKSERRHKDRQEQDLEEKHQVDIKLYKQSVKHLLNEHHVETTDLKTNFQVELKLDEDEHRHKLAGQRGAEREVKTEIKMSEMTHESFVTSLKQKHDESIAKIRSEFERKSKELRDTYDMKMKRERSRLESKRKRETQAIEERKNSIISSLMKEHETAFSKIKAYYHDITHTNLDKIKSLKEDVALLKSKAITHKKKMEKITNENKKMVKPLKIARADVAHMREQLKDHEKDKELLDTYKKRILRKEERLEKLRWKMEVHEQKFAALKKERDQLHSQFHEAVHSVKQRSNFKSLLIDKKLGATKAQLDKIDAHVSEALSRANVENLSTGGTDIIERKNQEIRDLQERLEVVVARHNGLIGHYEGKLLDHGIPVEELGFMPNVFNVAELMRA